MKLPIIRPGNEKEISASCVYSSYHKPPVASFLPSSLQFSVAAARTRDRQALRSSSFPLVLHTTTPTDIKQPIKLASTPNGHDHFAGHSRSLAAIVKTRATTWESQKPRKVRPYFLRLLASTYTVDTLFYDTRFPFDLKATSNILSRL